MERRGRYPAEVRERAVRLVFEQQASHTSQWAAIEAIAGKIGYKANTLWEWVRRTERDNGQRPGLATSERERFKELEREGDAGAIWGGLPPMDRPGQCTGDHGIGRSSPCREATMQPSDRFADNLVAMIWECRWLAIGLALSFTALACSRTPMDEQHGVTTNTIGPGGGAGAVTSGGTTGTIGNTGGGDMRGSSGGTGGITGAGGNRCAADRNTCATDDDCTRSDYRPPVLSPADCYCFVCGYVVSNAIAVDCEDAYNQFCGPNWQAEHQCVPPSCPVFPGAVCIAGMCQQSSF